MDNPFESPAVLSICPGILGLERGLERAIGPIRTIAYVEIEAFAVENLLAGMEAGILAPAPVWTNLKTFPWEFFRGKVDILMGGYPCQPFSNAGLGRASADPRYLWPYIEGGAGAIRPVACFFENVAGHLNKGYREVKWSLEKMGYVVKEGIFAAEEVGAPHQRERLFILAILANAGRPSWWPDYSGRNGRDKNHLQREGKEGANRFECPGEELAYAYGSGHGAGSGGVGHEGGEDEGEAQGEDREWLRGFPGNGYSATGVGLADSCREGLEKFGVSVGDEKKISETERHRWPSPPPVNLNTAGKPRVQLNPAWVAQLMGTTLEKTFFVPLVTPL